MDLSNLMGNNKPQAADPVTPPPIDPVVTPVEPVVTPVEPVVPEVPAPEPVVPTPEPMMPPPAADPVVTPVEPVVSTPEPMTPPPAVDPVVTPVEPTVPEIPTPVEPVVPTPELVVPSEPAVAEVTPTVASVAAVSPGGEVFEGMGSGKYKVVVLKDKCIGAASCIAVSPKTFELNDQQIAKVLPTVSTETDENLLLAAQSCPTLAIEVYDTASGEKVWPK